MLKKPARAGFFVSRSSIAKQINQQAKNKGYQDDEYNFIFIPLGMLPALLNVFFYMLNAFHIGSCQYHQSLS